MQIIVTGHGNFATGIESTVHLLAGSISNVQYIDFTGDMSEEDLAKKFDTYVSDTPTLFFCDLIGGTPYKQAAVIQQKIGKDKVAVIAGCNVGSLLEIGLQTDLENTSDVHGLAQQFMDKSHDGIREFGVKKVVVEDDDEDGI